MSTEKGIGDIIKRIVSTGVGAAFMSEEAIKNVLADLPLPKDIVQSLVQNAKGTKEEFMKGIQEEISKHLSSINVAKVAEELLENFDLEIHTKISFHPKKKKHGTKSNREN